MICAVSASMLPNVIPMAKLYTEYLLAKNARDSIVPIPRKKRNNAGVKKCSFRYNIPVVTLLNPQQKTAIDVILISFAVVANWG